MTKGTSQMGLVKNLEMGRCSWIFSVCPRSSQGSREKVGGQSQREIGRCYPAGLEIEGRGHEPRNVGTSRSWKSAGNGFSPGASRGNSALPTPWHWPRETHIRLWPRDLQENKPGFFSAIMFVVICYSSRRPLTQRLCSWPPHASLILFSNT